MTLVKRHKELIADGDPVAGQRWAKVGSGSPYIIGTDYNVVYVDNMWLGGYDTPNYHQRKRKGELIPMTPFHQTHYTGSVSASRDVYYYDGQSMHYWTEGDGYVHYPSWHVSSEMAHEAIDWKYAKAYVQEAAANAYSEGYDALTAVAELADVRRMFSSLAKTLVGKRGLDKVLDLPSTWLEARYGWRPLIYDLKEINEAIKNFSERRTRLSKRKGGDTTTILTTDDVAYWSYIDITTVITDTITIGFRGSVVADITVPKIQLNPLVTGWELLPFSFVVDWFVSIGKAIEAMSFLLMQSNYTAAMGCHLEWTRTTSSSITNEKSGFVSGHVTQNSSFVATVSQRVPTTVPLIPQLKLRLNRWKIGDLLMLLAQRIR